MNKDKSFEIYLKFLDSFLSESGEDLQREELKQTPEKSFLYLKEQLSGYKRDPLKTLKDAVIKHSTEEKTEENIAITMNNIRFISNCEHHMSPIDGIAHISYIPNSEIVGIGRIIDVVQIFSKRLQNQERITKQISDTVNTALEPLGVAVYIKAKHYCMICGNNRNIDSFLTTKIFTGFFNDNSKNFRNDFINTITKQCI